MVDTATQEIENVQDQVESARQEVADTGSGDAVQDKGGKYLTFVIGKLFN